MRLTIRKLVFSLFVLLLFSSVASAQSLPFRIVKREQLKVGGSVKPMRAPRYVLLKVNTVLAQSKADITRSNIEDTLRALLPRVRRDAEHRGVKFDGITADLYQSFGHIREGKSALGRVEWWPKGHSFRIENDANILNKATYVETIKIYALPETATVGARRLTIMKRREVFTLLVRAKERALREAEEKYLTIASRLTLEELRTFDLTGSRKNNAAEFERLHKKYREKIMRKFEVSEAQLKAIKKEGGKGDWPLLPR